MGSHHRFTLQTWQVVVRWVLEQPPEEEGPCEVVDGVLLGGDGPGHHLGIEVIGQLKRGGGGGIGGSVRGG